MYEEFFVITYRLPLSSNCTVMSALPGKLKDPCGDRPNIPTNPLWHMGLARAGNSSSFNLLQSSIDWLTCQGKRNKPFDKDSKEFMHDLYEAFATGGQILGQKEAAMLADNYVNGNGKQKNIDANVYWSSVIVKDTMQAMKAFIVTKQGANKQPIVLLSKDKHFIDSQFASNLTTQHRPQSSKRKLLREGALLAEQDNLRLKNADNRFVLASKTTVRTDNRYLTEWSVDSTYDFEKFAVGYVTDIPLGAGRTLKLPDGLSEYLAQAHIGVAKVFDYRATWLEVWKES